MNQDKKSAYPIELKGSNVLHAMDQVLSSARLLQDDLSDCDVLYRIIYRSRTQEVRQSRIIRWKEKMGNSSLQLLSRLPIAPSQGLQGFEQSA